VISFNFIPITNYTHSKEEKNYSTFLNLKKKRERE